MPKPRRPPPDRPLSAATGDKPVPVKRRNAKRRLDQLTLPQNEHLRCGHYFFETPGDHSKRFEDDEHRRAAWAQHREAILAEWDRPDRMPTAFWDYDRDWPPGAESEAHAIWLLPETTEERRRQIEETWHAFIAPVLCHVRDKDLTIGGEHALIFYGIPTAFWNQHAPAVRARLMSEARAWRVQVASYHDRIEFPGTLKPPGPSDAA